MLRNIPEERKSHLHCDRGPKSRKKEKIEIPISVKGHITSFPNVHLTHFAWEPMNKLPGHLDFNVASV